MEKKDIKLAIDIAQQVQNIAHKIVNVVGIMDDGGIQPSFLSKIDFDETQLHELDTKYATLKVALSALCEQLP